MCALTDPAEGLSNLQGGFSHKLMQRGGAAPAGLLRSKRFGVYRNNVFASLINALRARYPVIERLVGEDFFEGAAAHFIAAHPPRSSILLDYGEGFSAFLASFEPADTLPYLPDVARLEWLRHRAYHAADRKALGPSDLGGAPSDRVSALQFEFHPSAALIVSPYPIVSIWETNAFDAETRPIGPDLAGEAALVVRPDYEVLVVRLEEAGHAFAAALAQGATLGKAAMKGAEFDGFNLTPAFAKLITAGAFCSFAFSDSESRRPASCLV
jgi:putative DNA-binding protein